MVIVYVSRYGNVEKIVSHLDYEKLKLQTGKEVVDKDFILFTYTDGNGVVPSVVEEFLKNNSKHLKGVVGSGAFERHKATYNLAASKISATYNVPIYGLFNLSGNEEEIHALKEKLAAL